MTVMRVAAIGLAAMLVASGWRADASAEVRTHGALAAPWAIVAHGELLRERVVIASWRENHRLMLAAHAEGESIPASELRGRPYVDLALFWGTEWMYLEKTPEKTAGLRPRSEERRVGRERCAPGGRRPGQRGMGRGE